MMYILYRNTDKQASAIEGIIRSITLFVARVITVGDSGEN